MIWGALLRAPRDCILFFDLTVFGWEKTCDVRGRSFEKANKVG